MRRILITFILAIHLVNLSIASSLTEDLDRFIQEYINTAPDEVQSDFNRGIDELRTSGILDNAINVGDYAPEFKLINAIGNEVSL